jgi:hypothetical protein
MTSYWMFGIIGMMCLFGIFALVFSAKGAEGQAGRESEKK